LTLSSTISNGAAIAAPQKSNAGTRQSASVTDLPRNVHDDGGNMRDRIARIHRQPVLFAKRVTRRVGSGLRLDQRIGVATLAHQDGRTHGDEMRGVRCTGRHASEEEPPCLFECTAIYEDTRKDALRLGNHYADFVRCARYGTTLARRSLGRQNGG
jgi:hypothetical protein